MIYCAAGLVIRRGSLVPRQDLANNGRAFRLCVRARCKAGCQRPCWCLGTAMSTASARALIRSIVVACNSFFGLSP